MASIVAGSWRFAIGVDAGLKRPVLEVGALPLVFKVRSMVEDPHGQYRHGYQEGVLGSTALRALGTERIIREAQRGNMMTDGASR